MWFFIWLIVTVFIVGVSLWSYLILRQQKMAWKKFAGKHKFTYASNKLMESPSMSGLFKGHTINLYTDTQTTADMRGFRYVTVVELELGSGIPVKAAIGTLKTKEFVNGLALKKDVIFDHEKWAADFIARTDNKKRLKSYMNQTRMETLMALFMMKGTTVLFFCDEVDAVIRIETNDPLRNADKMERILKRLVRDMGVLAPTNDEQELLPKYRPQDDDDDEDDEGDYIQPAVENEPEDAPMPAEAEETTAPLTPLKQKTKKSAPKNKKKAQTSKSDK